MTGNTSSSIQSDDALLLLDLLSQQRDLYSQLKVLSDQQSALIAQGQTEQLLQVLTQRQGLVESLSEINERLSPYRHRWASVARTLPQVRRAKLRSLVDEVQQLLAGIVEQDEADRRQLEAAQADVGRQLRQVTHVSSAVSAYKTARPAAPARFTDRQG